MTKYIRSFKKEGFSLRVEALNVLKNILNQQNDDNIRSDLVSAIIDDLKEHCKSNTTMYIISEDDITKTIENISNEQNKTEKEEIIQITNAFNFPYLVYNSSQNTYEKFPPNKISLHDIADSKIYLMRNRFEHVYKRLLRNPMFNNKNSLSSSKLDSTIQLTSVEELIGSQGRKNVLGFLIRMGDDNIYLEDLSGYVKLQINRDSNENKEETNIMPSIYYDGIIVLIQGEMKGGVFECFVIALPKIEKRQTFLNQYPLFINQNNLIPIKQTSNLIILSDLWLDNEIILQKIDKLFEGYSSNQFIPEVFIFIGNFHSVPLDSLGTNTQSYINGFDNLAKIIEKYPLIQQESQLIFVPGTYDPFDSGILPRPSIPSHFIKSLLKFDNITFTSNPCKIQFYDQEIIIFRHDLLSKLQKLSLIDNTYSINDIISTYVKCILSQGHLSPVPLQISPVYWKQDYSLYLNILPHLLILADSCEQFSINYKDCNVINPSSFIQEYSFTSYTPYSNDITFSSIGETYTQISDNNEDYKEYI